MNPKLHQEGALHTKDDKFKKDKRSKDSLYLSSSTSSSSDSDTEKPKNPKDRAKKMKKRHTRKTDKLFGLSSESGSDNNCMTIDDKNEGKEVFSAEYFVDVARSPYCVGIAANLDEKVAKGLLPANGTIKYRMAFVKELVNIHELVNKKEAQEQKETVSGDFNVSANVSASGEAMDSAVTLNEEKADADATIKTEKREDDNNMMATIRVDRLPLDPENPPQDFDSRFSLKIHEKFDEALGVRLFVGKANQDLPKTIDEITQKYFSGKMNKNKNKADKKDTFCLGYTIFGTNYLENVDILIEQVEQIEVEENGETFKFQATLMESKVEDKMIIIKARMRGMLSKNALFENIMDYLTKAYFDKLCLLPEKDYKYVHHDDTKAGKPILVILKISDKFQKVLALRNMVLSGGNGPLSFTVPVKKKTNKPSFGKQNILVNTTKKIENNSGSRNIKKKKTCRNKRRANKKLKKSQDRRNA